MKLNEFQLAAVTEPPKDITVSAAAGSGKTQVLGARVLERITGENGVDVNRLLIVTFTRAAASEMRSRIGASIGEAARRETDPRRRARLERQAALLGGADICTIDSFCYRLLKQNFFKIPGLSGDFTVGDEEAVRSAAADALRDLAEVFSAAAVRHRGGELIEAYAAKADRFDALFPDKDRAELVLDGFEQLAMNYGNPKRGGDFGGTRRRGKTPDYIDCVYDLRAAAEACPDPDGWLAGLIDDSRLPFDKSAAGRFGAEAAAEVRADVLGMLSGELASGLGGKIGASFRRARENIEALPAPTDYAEAYALFQSKPFKGASAYADGGENAAEALRRAKKIWDGAAKFFASPPEDVEAFRAETAPAFTALCELTRCLLKQELALCMEKKTLSFSACVLLTFKLLTEDDGSPSQTALELRELYDEIYVDEAQDIDPRQKALFDVISSGRLFMVGDVKQSIYGFRGAEPEIFNARCADTGEGAKLITMNMNYRSNAAVIDAVNGVFPRLINKSTLGSDYRSLHELQRGESWLPETDAKAEFIAVADENAHHASYDFELEAQAVANRIKDLLASGMPVYDKSAAAVRPIKKKDILILMRAPKNDGPVLKRILGENRIDCFFDGGEGLYSKAEISTVTDLLTVIDNDERDIPLAATLRSVMFGFGENDLLKIRAVSPARSFSSIFRALADPEHSRHGDYAERLGDGALLARCLDFGEKLRRWRRAADFRPLGEVIGMILNETDYYSSVGAMKGCSRANLDALVDAAEQFEASGSKGLFSFLGYVSKQNLSPNPSVLEAKTLSESMDVVRIMSIHKSKGLEAPVVILMKCSAALRSKPDAGLLTDRRLGFSIDYVNEEEGYFHSSPVKGLIDLRRRTLERCEEIRLLYVAMTRPREKLILTGYFPKADYAAALSGYDGELNRSAAVFLTDSYAKMIGSAAHDASLFEFKLIRRDEVSPPALWERFEGSEPLDDEAAESFANLLGFAADEAAPPAVPAKVSVSALKGAPPDEDAAETAFSRAAAYPEPLRAPAFAAGERELSPAELGTAYHTVMEHLDFNREAAAQIDELAEKGIISEQEHSLIVAEKVQALLDSPLGERMRRAKKLFREAPFMMNLPAAELGTLIEGKPPEGTTVAVQGIIDCFFLEGDRVVLVDYKTDRYDDPHEIADKYEKQLNYYAKAINLKFCDKKIEKYLYLFFKGDIIEM